MVAGTKLVAIPRIQGEARGETAGYRTKPGHGGSGGLKGCQAGRRNGSAERRGLERAEWVHKLAQSLAQDVGSLPVLNVQIPGVRSPQRFCADAAGNALGSVPVTFLTFDHEIGQPAEGLAWAVFGQNGLPFRKNDFWAAARPAQCIRKRTCSPGK